VQLGIAKPIANNNSQQILFREFVTIKGSELPCQDIVVNLYWVTVLLIRVIFIDKGDKTDTN
jgi:hypothetical protein